MMKMPTEENITDAHWESVTEAATAVALLILSRLYHETDVRRALGHAQTIATFAIAHRED
jgi:hypothetical protein